MHRVLIPSVFLFPVCALLWGLHLSYYLLPLPHHLWGSSVHCFPSTGRGSPCRGSCFPFLFIVTPSGVPCRSSVWFLIFSVVSFSIDGLILLCQLSPVFCRVLSPFGCTSVGGSSISSPLGSPSSWRLVFLHGSSPSRFPSSTASSGNRRLLLYLSWPSPSSAVLRFSALSTSLVVVSFSLSPCLVAPWGFLLFAWATGGFVQCSLLSLCRVASAFLFPFCNPSSYGLHPDISMSAFPGYCLFRPVRSYFFLFVWALGRLAWFPCPASPSLVSIPLSFLQVVSSCPSLGALLTRSNLCYTTRRGLPLGRVSFSFASWRFIMVPIPHGSPLLLVALLLIPPRSCAGVFLEFDFLLGSFPFTWAPTCCFLRLLSVPSVCPPLAPILALAQVSHYFSVFPSWCLGRISVPSRRGPPSGPSLFCGDFRTFFPMVHFLSTSLSVFLVCSNSSFHFSVCPILSASEVFPCSFFPYLSCRLAFPAPLICFCSSF